MVFFLLFQHASSDVEKMILGNKCDVNDRRQVSRERGAAVSSHTTINLEIVKTSLNC
jgi:hypothetical protein